MPTIHAIHTIPTIHTKHTILSKHAIPDRPYTPYITIHTQHHTTPPPHHRGGGGRYHTPTTPQEEGSHQGEDLIWRQYMGPIPLGEGGWQGLVHICIYILYILYIYYIYIHMHNIMCIFYIIYTYINAFRLELTLSTIGNAICPCSFASTRQPSGPPPLFEGQGCFAGREAAGFAASDWALQGQFDIAAETWRKTGIGWFIDGKIAFK